MHHTYVFSVQFDVNGPYCDTFLEATLAHGNSLDEFRKVTAVARRMGMPEDQIEARERLERRMAGLQMRARITGTNIHCVHTEDEIDRTTLELVLQTKQQDNELKDFLSKSKIL
jgi:hypothetical protein